MIRRLVVTTCNQASGAPIVDRCWGSGQSRPDPSVPWWQREPTLLAPHGVFKFAGWAILLTPWKRDSRRGWHEGQRALVLGWVTHREPLTGRSG